MGLVGDQVLDASQNKTLAESGNNGVRVFLFEVHRPTEYTFVGEVRLVGKPYASVQPQQNGDLRRVWIFPVEPIAPYQPQPMPTETLEGIKNRQRRSARELSDEKLERLVENNAGPASSRVAGRKVYARSEYVAEFARRRAQGHCELCLEKAPFNDSGGSPYLECHHIVWLARGGEDTPENTVALCPNCHRKMHVLNLLSDRRRLIRQANRRSIAGLTPLSAVEAQVAK